MQKKPITQLKESFGISCKRGQASATAPVNIRYSGEDFSITMQYEIAKKIHPIMGNTNTIGIKANEPEALFFSETT
ncbi:MAG: hypothetical protein COU51_02175 [Parcubacteria group bacterium CG10_big_fil_rev_8_21_14_0_10_36_14]|nr:MAG: hypothetical protein COU51_02175 [Parcubacteria group bacterium CG10_big_fil_rev_8_21_14_0_10_36_14]